VPELRLSDLFTRLQNERQQSWTADQLAKNAAQRLAVVQSHDPLRLARIGDKTVRPARADSYEHAFRSTGLARTLTDWRTRNRALADLLREPLLERAIGVVYRPETELLSHYFEAVMAEQFDAWVWFAQSSAVTPLGHERPQGAPETWPFGL
jgi:hypothetical protein